MANIIGLQYENSLLMQISWVSYARRNRVLRPEEPVFGRELPGVSKGARPPGAGVYAPYVVPLRSVNCYRYREGIFSHIY